ncbi:glutamine-hydrolyzing GMP synthase [Sedimentisphaera salicampi]|uniref:GMP synthase [glutamine-hydrolyzing] n=1 Tax=Sedimentisphaera salicampi TaxID=1941349 RepID=A0A1W6LN35_9BACT|nr:glutamine-hydrolyzing GMP synthase [Sedimentisphaera salicampi]ARN57189.1 GMP synthase (glutamine-hydrolyzing) [Sedimentisphaera salicampi]
MKKSHEKIAIIDFGSQYGQLIARRVREQKVLSAIYPPSVRAEELAGENLAGIILSGGPASVYDENAPSCDEKLFDLGVPVLGICYGMQIASKILGADIRPAESREYGRTNLHVSEDSGLLAGVPEKTTVWMSHSDQVNQLNDDFITLAQTPTCPYAAVKYRKKPFYGVQFHPEVTHTPDGSEMLKNFLYQICECNGDWLIGDIAEEMISQLKAELKDENVICGLSGGVDSSVVAALLHKAIGDRLHCIFVDNGLLRENEREGVEKTFCGHFNVNLRVVDWSEQFLGRLEGITDPQQKRKIIGAEFIEAFKSEAEKIENAKYLAQGTLYPDVIESGSKDGNLAANIKLHHNVGGLPEELGFGLVEPLRDLFKDEVRLLGEYLGLPEDMVWRHPFPGPGLAVRIIGDITKEKLRIVRQADEILIDEIKAAGLYRQCSQTLAVLLPVKNVGVMGDDRSYESVIAVRSVDTSDFMTADFSRIPYDTLSIISSRIINEVRGVNRVVYDISSKPPATIEWE